jgi:osmotically inducible protein OsmC
MRAGDGVEGPYSARSRFEDGSGTNPEALLGAAHAGCFSMALAARLSEAGHEPIRIDTVAKVHLEAHGDGFTIERIDLSTEAAVPGIDEQTFRREAEEAKKSCPVSRLFARTDIGLEARLVA